MTALWAGWADADASPNGTPAASFEPGLVPLRDLLGPVMSGDVRARAWVNRFTVEADDGERYALVAESGSPPEHQFMLAPIVAARLVRDGLLGQKKKSSFPWGLVALVVIGLAYAERNRR